MSMTPDEIIAVVQAFKAGKEIEMRPKHYDTAAWTNTLDPLSVHAVRLALAWMRLSPAEQARRLSLYAPSTETPSCAAKS